MRFFAACACAIALSACGGASRSSSYGANVAGSSAIVARHAVAAGLTLIDLDVAPTRDATAAEVAARKTSANDDAVAHGIHEGSPAVFFFDFDEDALWFVSCRALPDPDGPPTKRSTRWKVEERLRVARSGAATKELGVDGEIAMYEEGVCGVRVGDWIGDVEDRLGKPTKTLPPQASDCMGYVFSTLYVYECRGQVTHVEREGASCP